MKNFWKHVLRSCIHNLGTLTGAACIIGLGIFIYVAMMDTLQNLESQIDQYYDDCRMADVFAVVDGISGTEMERLREIPGIAGVSGKMAEDIRILAEGQTEIVTVHLLSYDEDDSLNRMRISGPELTRDGIFLGSKMMEAGGYEAGTEITLLINGAGRKSTLQGVCYSPEYIYAIPPGGVMIPDGEIYDIACVSRVRMEELTGRKDTYQELGFVLKAGYTFNDVRYQLADSLSGNGLTALCDREDQQSYQMVDGEKNELVSIGTVLPVMFLSISVFMLYVVLKKMIDRDQSVIGTMKAMGMTDPELIGAYMMQGILVGVSGALLGSLVAAPFGRYMFAMYARFFNLPVLTYYDYPDTRVKGLLLAVAISAAAVYLGVRGILEITPAQAMRARTPKAAAGFQLPKALTGRLGTMERIGCRSILRNPFRGFLIVLAVGFPFAMSSVLYSFEQVAEQMFFDQFDKIQTYDMQISLGQFTSLNRAANTGMELHGVSDSEGVAQLAVELRHENRTEYALLYGLNKGSEMWRIMDLYGVRYQPPDDGIILNSRTADKLNVKKGDVMEVVCTGLTPEAVKIPVAEIVDENFGSGCYISGEGIRNFFNTGSIAGTILLQVQPGQRQTVREQLLSTGYVTWMVDTERILEGYRAQMQSMMAMINMFALMSVAAGGILIYNISMINIRERTTEFGTIMLMGGSDREIGRILTFEQLLYFIMGILFGFPGSFAVKMLVESLIMSDAYTIDMTINQGSYLKAFVICLVITAVTFLAQMRVIRNIHIAEVLKERE